MRALRFKCRHCGRIVTDGKLGQTYCGEKACRAARKRKWRRKKYASDPEYRLSQKESTAAWLAEQGGAAVYYREYRKRKRKARLDNQKDSACNGLRVETAKEGKDVYHVTRFAPEVSDYEVNANRDSSSQVTAIKTGRYELFPEGANRDSIMVEIRVVTG